MSEDEKQSLLKQLKREVTRDHVLFSVVYKLNLLLRRYDQDDTLFVDGSTGKVYEVHLTWINNQVSPVWPLTTEYPSFNNWAENPLIEDQLDYHMFDSF